MESAKYTFLGIWLFSVIASVSLLLIVYSFFVAHAVEILVKDTNLKIETVVSGLENPTSMAFLDSNEILVLEKDSGKVQRIVNGEISKNADLTIDINHLNERGLLGMAIQREQDGNGSNSESGDPKYLFLFYTEDRYTDYSTLSSNANVNASSSFGCNEQECEANQFNNRLYRYEYVNNKWVNPKILVDIPIYWNNRVYPEVYSAIIDGETNWQQYRHSEGTHQGGKLVIDNNNNIFLVTGDGGTCRNYDSCYRSLANGFLSGKTANKVGGYDPAGMGGILHVTNEGEPVTNGGIIADGIPGEYYYAYGIRNSFGIDIDPVTGNLWDTESGPEFGDEINLVKPGFNSGWAKIQGMWPIWNYTNLMRSEEIGYHYPSNVSSDQKLEEFDGRGHYSDPEFAWNDSKGVTAIKFLNTDKLGKEYEDDIFVGDANGNVYHFELNENRSELKLTGSLSDKIANDDSEIEDSIVAQGLNTVTDIQVGPDGYVYILSYSGTIHKVSPKTELEPEFLNMNLVQLNWTNNDKDTLSLALETNIHDPANVSLLVEIEQASSVTQITNSSWSVISTDFIPVNEMAAYNFSLDVFARDVNQLHSKVYYFDSNKTELSSDFIFGGEDGTFERNFSNVISTPPETKYTQLQLWVRQTLGIDATYFLDSINISKLSKI